MGVNGLLARAKREAQRRGQRPSTAHVLLVMVQGRDAAASLLSAQGVHESDLLSALKVIDPESAGAIDRAHDRAKKIAAEVGQGDALSLHLLLSLLRDARSAAHRSLEKVGVSPRNVAGEIGRWLGLEEEATPSRPSAPPPPAIPTPRATAPAPTARRAPTLPRPHTKTTSPTTPAPEPMAKRPEAPKPAAKDDARATAFDLDPERFPMLASLGRNLTAEAAMGAIDPVVGRDREVEQLLDVLARRRSNNPILVGPPGVGKTAIVEALALRLARGGEGVHGLDDRIVVELSPGALVSGTGVRGALAERMRRVRDEVAKSRGRIVLFIDEVHAVLAGGAEGPDDLAQELKASLARGLLPCIGATTTAEFRRHVERDPALARRFSPVYVDEPSIEASIEILRGIAPSYEAHHGVAFDPDALAWAVELSVRYLPDRMLPDKAIGIADLAGARVRRRGGTVVDDAEIAKVVAELARVPADRLLLRDADRLLALEALLAERIVGHDAVLARIADALRRGAAGLRGRRRPLGTFLFLGSTGVGKTETARAIAEVFFPGSPMTRIDMSDLSEAHGVARLLGAPPGYVGHDEGGQLTEAVRGRPYQLVLLDEVEKAHRDVQLALLPLLEDGRLTDGRGRTVDFTNTIVVMTSNLGVEADAKLAGARIGFGRAADEGAPSAHDAQAITAARRALPPELWNRIDEPLFFAPLGRADVRRIAAGLIEQLASSLRREHGIELRFDDLVLDHLVDTGGYDPTLGARPMRRAIARCVEAKVADAILRGFRGPVLRVDVVGGEIVVAGESASDAAE